MLFLCVDFYSGIKSLQIKSKEKKLRDHGSQEYLEAETRRRHVKALPQLLDIVHVIFLSYGKSIMAHAELMHRISASQKTKGDSSLFNLFQSNFNNP